MGSVAFSEPPVYINEMTNATAKKDIRFRTKATLVDEKGLGRMITRLAHNILDDNKGIESLAVIGMKTRGEFIARRIVGRINEIENARVPVGVLDVSFYRDDFRTRNRLVNIQVTDIPFDINEKNIFLVDDVLYTGRTIRAAMDALMDFGRPSVIRLIVLVDREHRELPIAPNFVGKNIPTSINEEIRVRMREIDGEDAIYLVEEDHGDVQEKT